MWISQVSSHYPVFRLVQFLVESSSETTCLYNKIGNAQFFHCLGKSKHELILDNPATSTVDDLSQQVETITGVPAGNQRLIFKGMFQEVYQPGHFSFVVEVSR